MLVEFFNQFDDVGVTYHGAEELIKDKRGVIPLPSKLELMNSRLIEFYEIIENNKPIGVIQKVLLRISNLDQNHLYDYSYVISKEGLVVSAWANSKTDDHRIMASFYKYYCPPKFKYQKLMQITNDAKSYKPIDKN